MELEGFEVNLAAVGAGTTWAPPPLISTGGGGERWRLSGANARMGRGAFNPCEGPPQFLREPSLCLARGRIVAE